MFMSTACGPPALGAGRFERHMDVENDPDLSALVSRVVEPLICEGEDDPDCAAPRWRRERVGRAVIRDVAIRATPVRCPHKRTPNHAPTLSPNIPDHVSVVAIVTERRPSSHTPHPDPPAVRLCDAKTATMNI
jgi:hypothetical protein